ncbi:MAG: DUF721 domain-containing protein [Deltaproteobacteria bacterium]|nr:DUF721 domain-containing protein [Deltaproteobacteria bacterium]MBW2308772.1 DUF721 domain-containing protein [Deltaproteobacteria bacterium]
MRRGFSVPQSLADVLEKSSKRLKFTQHVREYRLRVAWMKAVGRTIAQHAQPARITGGVLTLDVDSPVWVQELKLMAPEILSRLRRYPAGRSVDKIRFRIGTVEPIEMLSPELPERLSGVELDPDTLIQLDRLCAPVADSDLRGIIRRVVEKDAKLRRLREIEGPAEAARRGKE